MGKHDGFDFDEEKMYIDRGNEGKLFIDRSIGRLC